MNEAGEPVLARPLDQEVRGRLAGAGELGPDAAIVRHQLAVGERRPVGADARVKCIRAVRVDVDVRLALGELDIDSALPSAMACRARASLTRARGTSQTEGPRCARFTALFQIVR